MMALLGLLAYKAFKGGGDQAAPTDSGTPRTPTRRGVAGCRDQSRTAVGGREQHLIPRAISGITCDCPSFGPPSVEEDRKSPGVIRTMWKRILV
jgi:hypothetical protein